MPSEKDFIRLMEDSTSFCNEYRTANIDPAHRRADTAFHGILENEQDYIERKRSALFIPKTRDHCTRWMTTITNAVYLSDDMVTLTNSLAPDRARFTNEVVNLRLEKYMPTFNFISKAADATVKYGNAIGKTGWEFKTETKEDRFLDGSSVRYESPERDGPFLELVPFENVQYDYRVISEDPVEDSPFWRQWIPMYVGDVKAKFDSKEWKKPRGFDWKRITAPESTALVRSKRQGKMADPSVNEFGRSDGGTPQEELTSYRQVWIVENYFRIAGTDWTYLSLGDEAIVTKPERVVDKFMHGRRPFSMSQFSPESFRSYSDGIPEKFRHPQAWLNALVNMRIDNQNICINKGHYVRRDAGVQLQSLLSPRAGMVTLGDDITENAIRPMEPMDVTASAYREQEIAERILDEISGQSGNRLGVESADRQTATEAAIKASASGEHEGFVIKNFVDMFLRPLFSMMVVNIVGMETSEEVLLDAALITGMQPDPSLLVHCELVINAGMGSTNKELRAQRIGVAIDRGIQLAQVDPTFVGTIKELYRELLPLIGLKAVERFIPPSGMQRGALGAGAGSPSSPGEASLPSASPSGVSPPLSQAADQIPALGGYARGMLQ